MHKKAKNATYTRKTIIVIFFVLGSKTSMLRENGPIRSDCRAAADAVSEHLMCSEGQFCVYIVFSVTFNHLLPLIMLLKHCCVTSVCPLALKPKVTVY